MRYLKNCWYQAGWSEELGVDAPLVRTVAEVPLMFMRDGAGRPAALMDRCAHRFAPLSAGKWRGAGSRADTTVSASMRRGDACTIRTA